MRHVYQLLTVTAVTALLAACSAAPQSHNYDDTGSSGGDTSGDPSSGSSGNGSNGSFGGGGGNNGSTNNNGGNTGNTGGGTTTNGQVDKTAACDNGLPVSGDAATFAKALGICTDATKDGYGVVSATYSRAFGSTQAPANGQWGILPKFGNVITPREGGSIGVLSSGYAREYDNSNGTDNGIDKSGFVAGADIAGHNYPTGAAPPGFPKAAGGCQQDNVVNDMIDVKLVIKAPMDANGFKFDFDFYSSEWPNYVCSNFNDAFIAYLTSQKTTDNISFDAKGNPVAVNNDYFDRCTANAPVGCLRSNNPYQADPPMGESACGGGPNELEGTGFAYTDQTQCNNNNVTATLGGATGWLTTVAPIQGGETFTLEFMIWDAGDGALDSSVLLDNFQWIGGQAPPPATPQTTRVN